MYSFNKRMVRVTTGTGADYLAGQGFTPVLIAGAGTAKLFHRECTEGHLYATLFATDAHDYVSFDTDPAALS